MGGGGGGGGGGGWSFCLDIFIYFTREIGSLLFHLRIGLIIIFYIIFISTVDFVAIYLFHPFSPRKKIITKKLVIIFFIYLFFFFY